MRKLKNSSHYLEAYLNKSPRNSHPKPKNAAQVSPPFSALTQYWVKILLVSLGILFIGLISLASAQTPSPEGAAIPLDQTLNDITELQASDQRIRIALDSLWVIFASCLIFLTHSGFAMLEAGFCRAKNTVSILSKNLIVFGVATLAFWSIGFGLMYGFGGDWQNPQAVDNGLIGLNGFFLHGADNSTALNSTYSGAYRALSWSKIPIQIKFFFQLTFAATAVTIISGAVAERIKFFAFCLFCFFFIALVYPIAGHWVWGDGWLAQLGFYDFAGSTVVHSLGGWSAFTGVLILGPRIDKYKNGQSLGLPGHNLPLATLGCLLLWLAWFGFNPGSVMEADPQTIGHVLLTTNMSAAAGMVAATIGSWKHFGNPDLSVSINGVLAGLVSITAGCRFVSVEAALVIGLISGVMIVYVVDIFDFFRIDDPVGAISVHLVSGIWGTLAVGLFAMGPEASNSAHFVPYEIGPQTGLLLGGGLGGLQQLLIQIVGITSIGLFTIVYTWLGWTIIKAKFGIRVSRKEELRGLDISEYKMRAYHDFMIKGGAHQPNKIQDQVGRPR